MLKGFKEFLLRGNLIELAVAFVIGIAFTAVVTSLVDNVLMPIVGKIFGQPDFSEIDPGGIPIGVFLNDVVAFLMIAAALYFLVVTPYNKVADRLKKPEEETLEEVEESVVLLREIRDALTQRSTGGAAG